ncbi:coatomer subunit zeta-1-like [Narcine bancroftii]|uniref:coatomer subunit zeta-1-like n=1 Tax=Narcine bancroftii TaxID=1343680 RepID=UPI003831BB42
MWDLVKGLIKVYIDNIHSLSFIYLLGGYQYTDRCLSIPLSQGDIKNDIPISQEPLFSNTLQIPTVYNASPSLERRVMKRCHYRRSVDGRVLCKIEVVQINHMPSWGLITGVSLPLGAFKLQHPGGPPGTQHQWFWCFFSRNPPQDPSLYTVKAVLILDNDGERILAKYYDNTYSTVKEQKIFEKNIFNTTHRMDGEIALLEGLTVVYKSNIDLYFYVIGSAQENELMLVAVLNCLFDSLSLMFRKNVEKRALLDNMEGLFLAIDEIVDGGVILESDSQQVVQRVALRADDIPLTEQTVAQVLQSAKEQIKWSLLR